jgi:hypothetical protein
MLRLRMKMAAQRSTAGEKCGLSAVNNIHGCADLAAYSDIRSTLRE